MTIHSDWSRIFHEECPEAFHLTIPQKSPKVGVIDGHLQLMCLHKGLASWTAFLQYLFIKPIMLLFAAGCPRVVLCFDCYDNVPLYKSMTQIKRVNAKRQVCVFNPEHGLPARIPDDPMLFLMNRDFKIKLVEMICERVPAMIQAQMKETQELIIDYKRAVVYSHKGAIPRVMDEIEPMGESDVKFCRYVDLYGNALVHAIDGDYLAIALLYYTKRAPVFGPCNQIHIFRQLATLPETSSQKNKNKKSKTAPVVVAEKKRKIVKCWVDVQLLYITIVQSMWQSVGHQPLNVHTNAAFSNADAVHAAVFLMLLAGTDFSRSLPWLGPKRMWDNLPNIVASLLQAAPADMAADDATIDMCLDLVIAKLYRVVFAKHCSRTAMCSLEQTLAVLHGSTLSDSVKGKFPSREQAVTTVQNVMWVMAYWKTHNGMIATPLDGSNGFARCPVSQQVMFADEILPQ